MICLTTIFFSENFHIQLIENLKSIFRLKTSAVGSTLYKPNALFVKVLTGLMLLHFSVQLILPFRYLLYDGELFWTEQGFRFSWRVMLIEKAGTAFFYIRDKKTGKEMEVSNSEYLTQMQEKMMATQPDMLINYAHFLKQEFEKKGFKDPEVLAESYVTLNGKTSRLIVDKTTVLSEEEDNLKPKKWIIPIFNNK
jgi:hypothetical protein